MLAYFCKIRLIEQRPNMSEQDRERMMHKVIELYRAKGSFEIPLIYMEEIISKTFDKIGSYSYYKKASRARRQSSFEDQVTDAITIEMGEADDFSGY